MAFRLPPLNTLRLFEAAGRHLSFKLAAQELDVTPSGVSHAVQTLEEWLGTTLFARTSRGLTLTPSGEAYLPSVTAALSLLSSASDRVPGRRPLNQIVVSVAPTFGSRILLPLLGKYRKVHPELAIMIDTTHRQVEFPRDGVDLAIRMGKGNWPGLRAVKLVTEELVPVCSPAFKEKLGGSVDFDRVPLIHISSVSEDWNAWSNYAGRGDVNDARGLRFDTIQMAMDAAARGLGVAIGRKPLVNAELETGRLVVLLEPVIVSKTAYWLVGPEDTMRRAEIVQFADWLLDEMKGIGPLKQKSAGRRRASAT